jgi:hypothetical protein
VLYISGYSDENLADCKKTIEENMHFLQKSFNMEILVKMGQGYNGGTISS